jgi:RimJ/RimL family protein N-acetyltransferase
MSAPACQYLPFLVTDRLELWLPQATDLPGLFALTSDPEVRRHLGPSPPSEVDSAARMLRNAGSWHLFGHGNFTARFPGSDRIVGTCGIFRSWRGHSGLDNVPEAGWIMNRECWGQGLATEAMRAVLEWFDAEFGPTRIACMIEEGNTASENVAAKLGFAHCARHEPEDEEAVINIYERLAG